MSKIVLHVRPWNNQFMFEFSEKLNNVGDYNEIIFVTMFSESYDFFIKRKKKILLLPDLVNDIVINQNRLIQIDKLLKNNNFGLNDILETERFFDTDIYNENYFYRYAILLDNIIDKNTLNVSLSLDHFIYCFSALLTNAKNGYNYSFIPVGVPYNSVVALKDSWNIRVNRINQRKIEKKSLTDRLNVPMTERLVYMKKQTSPNVFKTNSKNAIKYLKKDEEIKNHLNDKGYSLLRKIKRKITSIKSKNYYLPDIKSLGDIKNKFVYIPLHMEPEATVILYSTYFQSQIEMTRLISKVLPYGWEIVVKENPKMLKVRNKEFYKALKSIPNVKFVNMPVESTELIKKSEIVVALSGTSSLEAYLLDKPAILFGTPPHHKLLKYTGYGINYSMKELKEIFSKELNISDFYNDSEWEDFIGATLPYNMIPKRNNKAQLFIDIIENPPEKFSKFIQDTLFDERG
ncbi:hypothetical protein FDT66_12240 [Polaribacter aestuariivivens]|uniref:Capsule polysaccharide biosynthesis protein n=1 Tax=Polaribacter aestuariivivens TaxID=2304626 RepID=A0A5S3N1N4_9FLAO|nr:hypothetical protein [Polaribacter aestuariivivens]TMM29150.1 hypothetical protein FDT66_12240 [Polaribacter aestuariivivens]